MPERHSIFAWLVSLEALDAPAERQAALGSGGDLADLAADDDLVSRDTQGHRELAQRLAELGSDGWITWDWFPGLEAEEPPPNLALDEVALGRVAQIRIAPEGYSAFAARTALSAGDVAAVDSQPAYDLFISHASEDKDAVARPLARALSIRGFAVWFDEEQLEVGDHLRRSIDAGLAASRYGVVVLSHSFFEKRWTQSELDGLFAREMTEGEEVILPLWHGVDDVFMVKKAPLIAHRLALRTEIGIEALADRLARRLRRQQGQDALRERVERAPQPISASGAGSAIKPEPVRPDDATAPTAAREGVLAMLRSEDEIGLQELLAFERRAFERGVTATLQEAGDKLGSSAEPVHLRPVGAALWANIDRRLGSLLPLVEYAPEQIPRELAALVDFAGVPAATRSPFAAWIDGPRWGVWLVALITGTAATALGRFGVVADMWRQRAPYDATRPLPAARLQGGAELGAALLRARGSHAQVPELWYPAFAIAESEMLSTYYPLLTRVGETVDRPLAFLSRAGDFLWLCGALAGRDSIDMIRYWSASQVHPTLPSRIAADPDLAGALAAAVGVAPSELETTLGEWVRAATGPRV